MYVLALALVVSLLILDIGYPAKNELALLADLIAQAQGHGSNEQNINSLLHSDLGAQLPLHVSLSRPVVLRTEQRGSFTELLQKQIRDSHIAPYVVPTQPITDHTDTFQIFGLSRHPEMGLQLRENTLVSSPACCKATQ